MCTVQVRSSLVRTDARRDKTRFLLGPSVQRAKSALVARVKLWLKRTVKLRPYITAEETVDRQNAANENRVNDSQVNRVQSGMTYTLRELANVVDDNLLNEIREIQARIQ